ncbi:MAG: sigma-70 family RNA polymerase sigma factor [Bacteroidota bacterium]
MVFNNHPQIVEVWSNYKDGIFGYAFKRTQDKDVAEEITQQVLMKIYQACCNETEIRHLRSWLFQVTHNAIIDYQKQQQRLQSFSPKIATTEATTIWSDLAMYLEPLISFLPPKYALPLELSVLKGFKQAEIAQQLNLSLSATKSRILRAKNLLRKEIESCCYLEKRADGQILDFRIKRSCQSLIAFREQQLNFKSCC